MPLASDRNGQTRLHSFRARPPCLPSGRQGWPDAKGFLRKASHRLWFPIAGGCIRAQRPVETRFIASKQKDGCIQLLPGLSEPGFIGFRGFKGLGSWNHSQAETFQTAWRQTGSQIPTEASGTGRRGGYSALHIETSDPFPHFPMQNLQTLFPPMFQGRGYKRGTKGGKTFHLK